MITKSKIESYLSNSTNNNQYAALATRDDDDITVTISNCSKTVETANKAANPIQISKDLGIVYEGATGHFLRPGTPAKNIRPTNNPIVPGLAHTSLISIKILIDAGCKVTYITEHVMISTE